MDAWTFIWLVLILKIPVVALFLLVRWAIRETPDPSTDGDGGIAFETTGPREPRHPRPRLPRFPRRGPHHGESAPGSPPRVRTVLAHTRLAERSER